MSITVMCELRPRPDAAEEILQNSLRQLSIPASGVAGRRFARLYQHIDDPCWLLYVAEWESAEIFTAYRRKATAPGRPDQFAQPPVCRIYQRLALFERVLAPSRVARADIVDGPADTHDECRERIIAYHRASVRDRSQLVMLSVHETTDPTPGFLILSGWDGVAPTAPEDYADDFNLVQQLTATKNTVQRFIGRTVIENLGA
jgi:hypothetical protein